MRSAIAMAVLVACNGGLPTSDDAGPDAAAPDALVAADVVNDTPTADAPKDAPTCDHDCLGGACVDGMCQPTTFLSTASTTEIVLGATTVYFVRTFGLTSLESCAKTGCNDAPSVIAGPSSSAISSVAVNATDLYWDDPSTVWNSAINGSTNTVATSQTYAGALTIDATTIYWSEAYQNGDIRSCPMVGCNNSPTTLVPNQTGAGGLLVDGGTLYWIAAGMVMKASTTPDAGAPTPLTTYKPGIDSLHADATHLVWSNHLEYTITRCDKSNCSGTLVTLATGKDIPTGVAADAAYVYWTSAPLGTVSKCAIAGCNQQPTTIATNQDTPGAIAVDDTAIYFAASHVNGAMMRVAK